MGTVTGRAPGPRIPARTSPTYWWCSPRISFPAPCSARRFTQGQVRAESARRGQAGQPRRLLHRRRRHQGLPGPTPGAGAGPDRRRIGHRRRGSTRVRTPLPSASPGACGSAVRKTLAEGYASPNLWRFNSGGRVDSGHDPVYKFITATIRTSDSPRRGRA